MPSTEEVEVGLGNGLIWLALTLPIFELPVSRGNQEELIVMSQAGTDWKLWSAEIYS